MRLKEQGSGDAQAGKTEPEVARGADLADLASFVGRGKKRAGPGKSYPSEKLARLGAQETGLNLYQMQF